MSLTKPFVVSVDSDFKTTGTHSDFSYFIKLPDLKFDRVAVIDASIPRTFYTVSDDYNTNIFTLEEDSKQTTITVTPGNYTLRAFETTIKSLLNAGSIALGHSYTYTASSAAATAPQTGKITYGVSGNAGVQPKFIFPSNSTVFRVMGFEKETTNVFVGDSLTSPNVLKLTINSIYLKSNIIDARTNAISDNILLHIPNRNTVDFANIAYENTNITFNSKPFSNNEDSIFSFTFTDGDGNILNFNGIPCNFSLVFYKFNDVFDLIKKDILLNWMEKK